jgi:DNA gyrase C-terminal domain, beta-propeller
VFYARYGKRTHVDAYRLQTRGGKGVINMKTSSKIGKGMVSPTFLFGGETFPGAPFSFGGLRFQKDVRSYIGVDFGTSNSYAVTLWAAPKERQSKYPAFSISETVGERLRLLELAIASAREKGLLTPELAKEYSRREQASFVFHSVKLEGNSLTRGETELCWMALRSPCPSRCKNQ